MDERKRPGAPRHRTWGVAAAIALAPVVLTAVAVAQEPAPRPDVQPPARMAVSPGKFDVTIGAQPVVESLKLVNFGSEPVDIRVTVVPWDLDDDSRVRLMEPSEQSLDQWMLINPRSFTIAGESEQTVRFSIRPRTRPEDGEHRAMIYFEEIPRPRPDGQPARMKFKLGVAVYAYAGEVDRAGALEAVRAVADADVLSAAFAITNQGNVHVRMKGQYAIWPLDEFPGIQAVGLFEDADRPDFAPPEPALRVGQLPGTPVLGGTRRELPLVGGHGLAAGSYVLTAVGTLGEDEFREAVEFTVPATAPPSVAGQQGPAR